MKYWIVVENNHEGPFTIEDLKEMNVAPDTYAWHPGLPKWTRIADIPELAEALTFTSATPETDEETPATEEVIERPVEEPKEEEGQVALESPVPAAPEAPRVNTTPPPAPPVIVAPVPPQVEIIAPAKEEKEEEKPSTYLAWSIITTILFFLPLGIVAIIYSSKVNSQWMMGEHAKARRSSEIAAWFSNGAFVAGLIWFPFSTVIAMLL